MAGSLGAGWLAAYEPDGWQPRSRMAVIQTGRLIPSPGMLTPQNLNALALQRPGTATPRHCNAPALQCRGTATPRHRL
eukprot:363565-Chlamydomonas_euryale.AAC.5